MRNFILFVLVLSTILVGCEQRYIYTQFGKTRKGQVSPNKQETIKAKSDIDAYERAMLEFGSRILASKQIVSTITDSNQLKTLTPFPFCYTLLTLDGEKVSNRISINERIEVQEKVVRLLEEKARLQGVSLSKYEIVNHDELK
jgi:hypothetical protein